MGNGWVREKAQIVVISVFDWHPDARPKRAPQGERERRGERNLVRL